MGSDTHAKFSATTYISLEGPPSGVYGQVSILPTFTVSAIDTHGQLVSVPMFGVQELFSYGQIVSISGFDEYTPLLSSNINGVGDIIYYGDIGNLNLSSGLFDASMQNNVVMSGIAYPISESASLISSESNSLIFSTVGTVTLPDSEAGVYFLFSNHAGVAFSISSADPIVVASGTIMLANLSSPGAHLGLIGDGTKWIAIEENGVI